MPTAVAMKRDEIPREPTCTGCGKPTEGHYTYSFDPKTDMVTEIHCRDCEADYQKKKFEKTRVLTSKLTMMATMYQCEYPQKFDPAYEGLLTDITDLMGVLGEKLQRFGWIYRRTMSRTSGPRDLGREASTALSAWNIINSNLKLAMYQGARKYQEGHDPVLEGVLMSMKRLDTLMKAFERDVWFGGLHDIVRNAKMKGHSAKMPGGQVLSWACAGRVVFTLQDPVGYYISFITAEDEDTPLMGMQGILATETLAKQLICTALAEWRAGRLSFAEDGGVGII